VKTEYLQIRVTRAQKALLKKRASAAGQDMSTYVLSRVAPPAALRFKELLATLSEPEDRPYALAELNELLAALAPGEFREAVADADLAALDAVDRNRIAAMVEHAAHRIGVPAPAWSRDVPPLEVPVFATDLASLRAHLLRASPVAYRRRNLFVDAAVGDRV